MKNVRRQKIKKRLTTAHFIVAIWATVTGIYIGQLYLTNRLADLGSRVEALEMQRQDITLQNSLLKVQIASESALQRIEKKAKDMGFVPIGKNIDYITKLP